MIAAVQRAPCPGCGRSRLECWSDPCDQLMVFVKSIREPTVFQLAQQWCAQGGFDLYRARLDEWPIARPRFFVGDGVHYSINGDSYPATVIDVTRGESRVVIQKDRIVSATLFMLNPRGQKIAFTRRRDGAYRSSNDGLYVLDLGRRVERNREL